MKEPHSKNFLESYSKGFTLVELLLYSAIFAVVAGLLTGILIVISRTQTREVASFKLQRQLQFVTQRIQYAVRDASVVESIHERNNPLASCVTLNHCSLRLRTRNSATDPTTISSDAAGVYIQEGSGPITLLTAAGTNITSLRFTKTRNPGGLLTVAVDLAMVANPDDPQLKVARSLASAVAHVSAATFSSDLLPDAAGVRNVGGTTLRWRDLILSGGVNIRDTANARELSLGTDGTLIGGTAGAGVISMMTNHGLDIRTNNISRMAITNAGNVGIGTTAPGHPLHMGSGAHVTTGGVWTNASSREQKENIRDISYNEAKSALMSLKPVKFNYKAEKDNDYLGFIAEDVSYLVATKDRKGLSSMDVVAVLARVVQQQQTEIEELRALLDNKQ